MASLSGLGAMVFLERFLGAAVSSWHQNSTLNPFSAVRFLNTLDLRKWRTRLELRRTCPFNVTAFSPQNSKPLWVLCSQALFLAH